MTTDADERETQLLDEALLALLLRVDAVPPDVVQRAKDAGPSSVIDLREPDDH